MMLQYCLQFITKKSAKIFKCGFKQEFLELIKLSVPIVSKSSFREQFQSLLNSNIKGTNKLQHFSSIIY